MELSKKKKFNKSSIPLHIDIPGVKWRSNSDKDKSFDEKCSKSQKYLNRLESSLNLSSPKLLKILFQVSYNNSVWIEF